MRQDFFTYEPQFTLLVAGNHKPSFKVVDEAIRRRVQLVPFLQNIPTEERDPELPREAEGRVAGDPALDDRRLPGVAAAGAQPARGRARGERELPRRRGHARPVARRAVRAGRQGELTPFDALFADWKPWCEANGGPAWGGKTFSKALDERGFRRGQERRRARLPRHQAAESGQARLRQGPNDPGGWEGTL